LYDRFLIQLDNCIQLQKNNINQLHDNLLNEIQQQLEQQHFNLQKAEIAVKHLNPDKILQRGFAIIYKGDSVISNANKLNNDDTVKIVFHKGNAIAVIKKIIQLYEKTKLRRSL
jgi:exodeoxyribonuclease VII large subunit